MQNLDLMYMTLLLLPLLLILALLSVFLWKSNQQNRATLLTLLAHQTQENQSLRNQLRAGDPMTLHSLQYATGQSTSNEEQYQPSYDEGVVYHENMQGSPYRTVEADDDFNARGWDSVTVADSGGSPVNFGNDS
jgi:hypothetical protein